MRTTSEDLRKTVTRYTRRYAFLFCHRRNAYALQTDEGTYYAVRKPVSPELIEAHLLGKITAGWYALDEKNTLRWAALDADAEDGLAQLQSVGLVLRERGWPAYIEESRRGGHLWIFFAVGKRREERIKARPVRLLLAHLLQELRLNEEIELFPKQDELDDGGLGSLIRGPLGVHRTCGRRFGFLDLETLEPVARTFEDELEHMTRLQPVTGAQVAEGLVCILDETSGSRDRPEPSGGIFSHGRGAVEQLKEEIGDIYAFICQFVELDEKGRGHCPFHPPDRHPSFAVNREENYWVDFHDQTGGDAIAFYRRFRGISFMETFKELAQRYGRVDLIEELKEKTNDIGHDPGIDGGRG